MARRPLQDNYRLNVYQIPALRALGCAIVCVWVLCYDGLIAKDFSLPAYAEFVAIMAAYCLGSWLCLVYGCNRLRAVDLGLVFLVLDLPFLLYGVHRTG